MKAKSKYFQRDLEKLTELFDSELFKTAYEVSDEDNLIVQWAKALTIKESFKQNGSRLKNGKISTVKRYPFSSYDDEIKNLLQQYNNHIKELKNKMSKIEVQESIQTIHKECKQNLKKIYTLEGEDIEFSFLLNVVSWVLLDNWRKKFNKYKIYVEEVQAMLVL